MKQSITQKHPMACGLACVAYVANQDYKVLASRQPSHKLNLAGFHCPTLVNLLNSFGCSYRWKKLTSSRIQQQFKIGDIVFIKRSPERPGGHFLTKTEFGWMDPWINIASNRNIDEAKSGYLKELPGEAEYVLYSL